MAARSLGTLTLDLVAKIGGFTAGLTQAEREADKKSKAIEGHLKGIGVASLALGNALGSYLKDGITAAANAFPALIDQAAQFQDIADMTGGSAEGFANFAVSAKVAGVEMDTIASASAKLSKALIGVDDDSKAAGAGLEALGINVKEFKQLSADQQIKAAAEAFAQFADGTEKAAVAQQIFKGSGAELLKFFKDYTDNGGDVNILTGEMIQKADDFADATVRLRTQIGLTASALATEFIGPAETLIKVIKDAINETYNLNTAAAAVGSNNGVRQFAEDAGRALASAIDFVKTSVNEFNALVDFVGTGVERLKKLGQFDFAGAADLTKGFQDKYGLDAFYRKKPAEEGGKKTAQTFVQAYDAETARLRNDRNRSLLNASNFGAPATSGDGRPRLRPQAPTTGGGKGGGGGGDDPTKALLDNQIKVLSESIEQEKSLFAERNKFLELYNAQGLVSVRDFYEQRQNILDEATAAQSKAYDEQAQALRDYIAKAPKETERASATGKLNDVLANQAKLHRAAGAAAIESSIKQVQAQREVAAAADEVNAKLLEFNGNLREAAAIRFDAQNQKLRDTFTAEGNTQAVKNLDTLRGYTLAQADLNRLQEQFSLAQGSLQIAEERIQIARERGTMGEIQSLRASGDARKEAVGQLREQLAAFQAIESSARSPAQNQAIERLKVQLEGLEATINPLADKFNTMLGDAAGNAFSDIASGAKTAKEAIKDFSASVTQQITQLVAKDLGNQLFKSLFSGGGGSAGGGWLANLFGSGGGGAEGGWIASLFANGFAGGGFTGAGAANDPAGIVHKNEYVLTAEQTRRIGVSNLDRGNFGGGGGGMVVNVNATPGMSRDTALQQGRQIGAGIQLAIQRNG